MFDVSFRWTFNLTSNSIRLKHNFQLSKEKAQLTQTFRQSHFLSGMKPSVHMQNGKWIIIIQITLISCCTFLVVWYRNNIVQTNENARYVKEHLGRQRLSPQGPGVTELLCSLLSSVLVFSYSARGRCVTDIQFNYDPPRGLWTS